MSNVELLDRMGTDIDVANAARVSMHKHSEELTDQDVRLIRFLARGMTKYEYEQIISDLAASDDPEYIKRRAKDLNKPTHWTPFAQCVIRFRMRMSLMTARQYFRSNVGIVRNEMSRRYVTEEPTFIDMTFREAPNHVKQGSGGEHSNSDYWRSVLDVQEYECLSTYNEMLNDGVAPEQARAVLPLTTETVFVETGSLYAYARICHQRIDGHAQDEISAIAQEIDSHLRELYPVSWPALMGESL